jgi:hypothetical protein
MEINKKLSIIGLILFGILAVVPFVSAYAITMPAYDLYEVFVETVFGSFWLAVLGLAAIIFIILALVGGLSSLTSMTYCGIFFLALAIGYGQALITIPLVGFILFWSGTQMIRLINVQSSLW